MLRRWLPWRFLVRSAARFYGVMDPLEVLAKVRSFSQPSEVKEPMELVRANLLFQARGLINTRVFQFNLDWIWPYWVTRQFDPGDHSFLPRGYSYSHLNMTHRNWSSVSLPGLPLTPVVDPRGLVTPRYDGWSLDCWLVTEESLLLIPSRLKEVTQTLEDNHGISVRTICRQEGCQLETVAFLSVIEDAPRLVLEVQATCDTPAKLAVAIRPYNPEGVHFLDSIEYLPTTKMFMVEGEDPVHLSQAPDKVLFSNFEHGDVVHLRREPQGAMEVDCHVGMANAMALYDLTPGEPLAIKVQAPLAKDMEARFPQFTPRQDRWESLLAVTPKLQVPDEAIMRCYRAAVRTCIQLSVDDIVPGPYTYRRFWFRDACLMANALLGLNLTQRVARHLERFPSRQRSSGYFLSQEGEWDSNGQVLWIVDRFQRFTGEALSPELIEACYRGADWIIKKRMRQSEPGLHQRLLPAGFSAEHFGPNDYYYWDDFWGVAGLKAAANMARSNRRDSLSTQYEEAATAFEADIWQSVNAIPERRAKDAWPTSPYRRLDAGAIGSMVADYPLQLTAVREPRIWNTLEFLLQHCSHGGGFFQDMVHSGVNAYLSFALAQTLLRGDDPRFQKIITSLAGMASATGHWPEAVHPITGGGCMGDGQHGWAAAEWALLVRSCFVREEGDALVLCQGVFPEWMQAGEPMEFGPTPTPQGTVGVKLTKENGRWTCHLTGNWLVEYPNGEIRLPGHCAQPLKAGVNTYPLRPLQNASTADETCE